MDEEEDRIEKLDVPEFDEELELDDYDIMLRELIPAILGDESKTRIQDLSEKEREEVFKFMVGMLQIDYTG